MCSPGNRAFRLTRGVAIDENHGVVSLKSLLAGAAFCTLALPGFCAEGLWPYNQFPVAAVKQKLGFDVEPAFLDHLRLSSVKIGNGSGAFVSPDGLLITTRQVVGHCLAARSSA